jgi:hypothetical protein
LIHTYRCRKRKQKKEKEERLLSRGRSLNRSTSLSGNKGVSKYGIARSELKPVETFEWEPPADSKYLNTISFIVFFLYSLLFSDIGFFFQSRSVEQTSCWCT